MHHGAQPLSTDVSIAPDLTASVRDDITVELGPDELAIQLRRWLCSGAQAPSGGLIAWIDHDSGHPAFEYPEITGYALTHFVGSPLQGEDARSELDAATKAASWLTLLIDQDLLAAREGWDGHAVYNFDLAMIANGLLSLGVRVEQDRLVEYGLSLVSRLIAQVARYGYLPSIDPETSPPSRRAAWSTEGVAHLAKVAQCMLFAADVGLDFAREAASVVVAKGILAVQPDGRILTQPDSPVTMLHPHLYAAEGFWVYGTATSDHAILDRARRAVEWAYQHRLETGGFPRYTTPSDTTSTPEQSDVTAQFLRLALLTEFPADLTPIVKRLCAIALPVPGQGRAIPYHVGPHKVHRNAWASMFATQALEMFASLFPTSLNWRHLV
jgi:hypothetical protein